MERICATRRKHKRMGLSRDCRRITKSFAHHATVSKGLLVPAICVIIQRGSKWPVHGTSRIGSLSVAQKA